MRCDETGGCPSREIQAAGHVAPPHTFTSVKNRLEPETNLFLQTFFSPKQKRKTKRPLVSQSAQFLLFCIYGCCWKCVSCTPAAGDCFKAFRSRILGAASCDSGASPQPSNGSWCFIMEDVSTHRLSRVVSFCRRRL